MVYLLCFNTLLHERTLSFLDLFGLDARAQIHPYEIENSNFIIKLLNQKWLDRVIKKHGGNLFVRSI